MPEITKSLTKSLRRQRQSEGAQMRQLMDVAEAARLAMGTSEDEAPPPRLMIENNAEQLTAEDAWRADHFARQQKKQPQRDPGAFNEWMPSGLVQFFGFRAAA